MHTTTFELCLSWEHNVVIVLAGYTTEYISAQIFPSKSERFRWLTLRKHFCTICCLVILFEANQTATSIAKALHCTRKIGDRTDDLRTSHLREEQIHSHGGDSRS